MCKTKRKPSEGVAPLTLIDTIAAKLAATFTSRWSATIVLPPPIPVRNAPVAVKAASLACAESRTKLAPSMAAPEYASEHSCADVDDDGEALRIEEELLPLAVGEDDAAFEAVTDADADFETTVAATLGVTERLADNDDLAEYDQVAVAVTVGDADSDGEAPVAATLAVTVVLAVTVADRDGDAVADADTDADADLETMVAATLGVRERLADADDEAVDDQVVLALTVEDAESESETPVAATLAVAEVLADIVADRDGVAVAEAETDVDADCETMVEAMLSVTVKLTDTDGDADGDIDADGATDAGTLDDDDEGDIDGDDEMESPGVSERVRLGLGVELASNSTTRQVDMRRMRLLDVSATNRKPAMSAARP